MSPFNVPICMPRMSGHTAKVSPKSPITTAKASPSAHRNRCGTAEIRPGPPRAVIASEDNRFCEHAGFDWVELRHQVDRAWAGESTRGASTITMQVAKNVLLWPGRDPVRKLFEAILTPQIELFWNKRRIIEVYLNVAETGIGTYGANAGAMRYFHHDASRLTRQEAARIAAVLPLPKERRAVTPRGFTRRYGNSISARMQVVESDGLDSCLR